MTIFYNPDSPLLDQMGIANKIIEELEYQGYARQRNERPDMPAEAWASIYPKQKEYEARYQTEIQGLE